MLFFGFSKFPGNFFYFFFVPWKFVGRGRQLFCQSLGVGIIYYLPFTIKTKGDFINLSRSIRHPPVRTFLQGFICIIIGFEIPRHPAPALINGILNEINLIHNYLLPKKSKMRTKRTTRITSMMRGENTHHQEILMIPKSLRMMRVIKITPAGRHLHLNLLS